MMQAPARREGRRPEFRASSKPSLLMCAPDAFKVSYVINPWMQGQIGACSPARARVQWERLHGLLTRLAEVHLVSPAADSPDMVFTANAGLVYGDTVVPSRFRHVERQGEEPHFVRWFEEAGYTLADFGPETPFEGEGDALFSSDGRRLWIGHGPRTSTASHDTLRALWPALTVTSLRLVNPCFYHLDTCFAPLSDGSLLWFPEAFDLESRAAVEAYYGPEQRIAVSSADAQSFACNAVNVGRTVIVNRASQALQRELGRRGFEVLETPLDEFLKAGGAAKCLVLRLRPGESEQ